MHSSRRVLGEGIDAKQRADLPSIADESGIRERWRRLLVGVIALPVSTLSYVRAVAMCRYNASRFLGLPEACEEPQAQCPFSISHYNANVFSWIRENDVQGRGEYLARRDVASFAELAVVTSRAFVRYAPRPSSPDAVGASLLSKFRSSGGSSAIGRPP